MSSGGRSWRYLNLARRVDFGRFWDYVHGVVVQGVASISATPDTAIYTIESSRRWFYAFMVNLEAYFNSKFDTVTYPPVNVYDTIFNTVWSHPNTKRKTEIVCKGYTVADNGYTVAFTKVADGWSPYVSYVYFFSASNIAYLSYAGHNFTLSGLEVLDARVYKDKMIAISGTRLVYGDAVIYQGNAKSGKLDPVIVISVDIANNKVTIDNQGTITETQLDIAGLYSPQSFLVDAKISPTLREIKIIVCACGYNLNGQPVQAAQHHLFPFTYSTYEITFPIDIVSGIDIGSEVFTNLGRYVASLKNTIVYNYTNSETIENPLSITTFPFNYYSPDSPNYDPAYTSEFTVELQYGTFSGSPTNTTEVPINCYYIAGLYYEDNINDPLYDNLQYIFFGAKGGNVQFVYNFSAGYQDIRYHGPLADITGVVWTFDIGVANSFSSALGSILSGAAPGSAFFEAICTQNNNIEMGFYLGSTFDQSTLLGKSGLQIKGLPLGIMLRQTYTMPNYGGPLYATQVLDENDPEPWGPPGTVRYAFYGLGDSTGAHSYTVVHGSAVAQAASDSVILDRNMYVDYINNARPIAAMGGEINPRFKHSMHTELQYDQRTTPYIGDPFLSYTLHKDVNARVVEINNGVSSILYEAKAMDIENTIDYSHAHSYSGPISVDPELYSYAFLGFSDGGNIVHGAPGSSLVSYISCVPYSDKAEHFFMFDIKENIRVVSFSSYTYSSVKVPNVLSPMCIDIPINLNTVFPSLPFNILKITDDLGNTLSNLSSVETSTGSFSLLADKDSMLVLGAASF